MKLKAIFIGSLFAIVIVVSGHAQKDDSAVLKGPYLGQKSPGMTPEIFAPGIVSTKACELHGAFSPDGEGFFFTRRASFKESSNRLMHMREEDGLWTRPQSAPFAEDCVELFARTSPDGEKVCFLSERAHPVTGKIMENGEKIWYSIKMDSAVSDAAGPGRRHARQVVGRFFE